LSAYLILYSGEVPDIIVKIFILGLMIGFLSFWIFMLIDAVKHSKDDGGSLRLLLLFLFGSVYGILYYFTVYRKRKETDTSSDYPVPE
jgi:hypothetical protein